MLLVNEITDTRKGTSKEYEIRSKCQTYNFSKKTFFLQERLIFHYKEFTYIALLKLFSEGKLLAQESTVVAEVPHVT